VISESICFANCLASASVGKLWVRLRNVCARPVFRTETETNQRFFTVRLAMCFETFVGGRKAGLQGVVVIRVFFGPFFPRKGTSLNAPNDGQGRDQHDAAEKLFYAADLLRQTTGKIYSHGTGRTTKMP
jgi:hypothetical protein